jgi:hypothetical protein
MEGISDPVILIKGAASPHSYALKPSKARALNIADAVFWIGGEFEDFLRKPVASMKSKKREQLLFHGQRTFVLSKVEAITVTLPVATMTIMQHLICISGSIRKTRKRCLRS